MNIVRKLACALIVAAALPVAAAGTPASAATPEPSTLTWTPCHSTVQGWDVEDTRSECTTVTVPLDYDRPDGRTISLAVSRIKATSPERRRGVVLINPGGPGNPGLGMPAVLGRTSVAGIGVDHDLVGFDPRGTGLSGGKECDEAPEDGPGPDPTATAEQQYRQRYQQTARRNVRCTGYDPEFIASLSTNVVADDMDRIRVALGEKKISYYGISWGTALGAVYRSRYDSHVDRMLLDSVMPPDFSVKEMNDGAVAAVETNFARFADWVAADDARYHLGGSGQAVRETVVGLAQQLDEHPHTFTSPAGTTVSFDGGRLRGIMTYMQENWPAMAESVVALREGRTPPLLGEADEQAGLGYRESDQAGLLMQVSVLCNDQGPDPDVDTMWREEQQRRAASPLFAWAAGYQHWCAGWTLAAQRWELRAGSSALQLVGHRYEAVTPYVWARAMQQRIGGALLTVENGTHGSLNHILCGSKAVEFFSTGRTEDGTCSGVRG